MKIYVNLTTKPFDQTDFTTTTTLAVDICWVHDNPLIQNTNVLTANLPWTVLSTATTLNAAVKQAVINDILAVNSYSVSLITDQMVFLGGFIGL